MDKILTKLIESNNRVVIPDFGAFIVKQLRPRKIVFNEFLKYNDGLLIDYISKLEKTDKEKASKKVEDYVNKISERINSGHEVTIPGLGILQKDNLGKINFEQLEAIASDSSTEKKETAEEKQPEETIEKTELKEYTRQTKAEKETKVTGAEHGKTDKKVSEKKDAEGEKKPEVPIEITKNLEEEKEKKKEEKKADTSPTEKPSEPDKKAHTREETKHETFQPKPSPKPEYTASRVDEPKGAPTKDLYSRPPHTPSSSNSRKYLWLTLLALLVIIVFLALLINKTKPGFFQRDKSQDMVTKVDADEPTSETSEMESSAEEIATPKEETAAPVEEVRKTTSPVEVSEDRNTERNQKITSSPPASSNTRSVTPSTAGKKYYIIVGSFKVESNADNFAKKLRNKGFPAEKIGPKNGFHFVSAYSYGGKGTAVNKLPEVREEIISSAYIMAY